MIMNGDTEWVLICLQGYGPSNIERTAFGLRAKIMALYEDHMYYSALNTSYGPVDQYVHKDDVDFLRNLNCR